MNSTTSIVSRLADVIATRNRERPYGSYTADLFNAGHAAISTKVIEEAYELIAAAGDGDQPDRAAVVHEAADVVYHLLVFLEACGCEWADVERELSHRFGVSGLVEKANRLREQP